MVLDAARTRLAVGLIAIVATASVVSLLVLAANGAFADDYQPISDMRASAEYRMLAAQNLLRRFFAESTGTLQRIERQVA